MADLVLYGLTTHSHSLRPVCVEAMVKRSTLKDQIKALLIKRILEGEYRSGDRLVELKIAREMGTSQAPVREALRELASLRLIENVPHKGTRVRSLGKQELLETFLVRGALEECATRLATPKLKSALAPLKAAIRDMASAAKRKDLKKVMEASTHFHRLVVEAADNRVLLDTWLSLHIETHTLVTLLQSRVDLASAASSHHAIVDAIATGDSEAAAKVARDHQNFYLANTAEPDAPLDRKSNPPRVRRKNDFNSPRRKNIWVGSTRRDP